MLPRSVNLIALLMWFSSAWRKRVGAGRVVEAARRSDFQRKNGYPDSIIDARLASCSERQFTHFARKRLGVGLLSESSVVARLVDREGGR